MTSPTTPTPAERAIRDLLRFFVEDLAAWLDRFADDAVVEFPYGPSIQRPDRLSGKSAIAAYFADALPRFRELRFSDLRVIPGGDPDVAVAEVHGSAVSATTGRRYEQDYVMVVRTRGGQVIQYREYWNPLPGIAAFGHDALPGGGAGV